MRLRGNDTRKNGVKNNVVHVDTSKVKAAGQMQIRRSITATKQHVVSLAVNIRSSVDRRNSINRLSRPKVRNGDKHGTAIENVTVKQPIRTGHSTAMEDVYLAKIREIIYEKSADIDRPSPTKILDYLYIGSYCDANNPQYLQILGITHVLNCAASQSHPDRCPYSADTGILWYEGIPALDKDTYDMLQHADKACAFIKKARVGGKVLVHCTMGVNRSAVLVACYLIGMLRMTLLHAVKMLRETRGTVLHNVGFQKQLVAYAKRKGQL
jgi:protein-tyrosine phosphatase